MGETRQRRARGALVFGTPISLVAIWSAIIALLSILPFSIVIGSGASFPISLAILGLAGILLGPVAGFVAGLIGGFVGVLIAPYTSSIGIFQPIPFAIAVLGAGLITYKPRNYTWAAIVLALVSLGGFFLSFPVAGLTFPFASLLPPLQWISGDYVGFLWGVSTYWPALILLLITSRWIRGWISSTDAKRLTIAVFTITYFVASCINHPVTNIFFTVMFKLPINVYVWATFMFATWERFILSVVGTVIGVPTILALRRAGFRKPNDTIW